MKLTHALTTVATTAAIAGGSLALATPADAATRTFGSTTYGLTCTYDLDQAAGTLAGHCLGRTPLGSATADFSGSFSGDSATGTISVATWFGSFNGTFSGTGWSTGTASGSYTMVTPLGSLSGTFTATA
ncbi:hypothetical protein [Nocardioides jiangxiensis]|uniref:Uncharacterized protein n=1 Tax=Nocardioides jiangxiensis TaxID=3064524 RepID=A0ABT9AZF6_9ACTN|nr:hypothetical protein [Nocardioides sp. WY-20]MDO7867773.1 hypothetical protein [Nocardioides sp. WY-20]